MRPILSCLLDGERFGSGRLGAAPAATRSPTIVSTRPGLPVCATGLAAARNGRSKGGGGSEEPLFEGGERPDRPRTTFSYSLPRRTWFALQVTIALVGWADGRA